MHMYDLIMKKKHGGHLQANEINEMIQEYTRGAVPEEQMAAMMMAICFQGMSREETAALTLAMRDSGEVLDLSDIAGIKVDKHSTGGVGDKTSIALAPLVSSVGVTVAKMSGRGLGHTGGTIDKLESFPGFTTGLTMEHFKKQVSEIGMAIMGQTLSLAPADKKLYALRDVTATVDQMSLIASSIMSKKLASGADAIVLDVKSGSGAFMKKEEDALALAKAMVEIGQDAGKRMCALVTDMDQPLGNAVGNALEVREAIDTLMGKGPADFTELCLALGREMVALSGIAPAEEAETLLREAISSGKALEQLGRFVKAQGGDPAYVFDSGKLVVSEKMLELKASRDGFVTHIDCDEVGMCSSVMGGGRQRKEDPVDLTVGILLKKKCGDKITKGDVLAELYYQDQAKGEEALQRLDAAYHIAEEAPAERKLILHHIV